MICFCVRVCVCVCVYERERENATGQQLYAATIDGKHKAHVERTNNMESEAFAVVARKVDCS